MSLIIEFVLSSIVGAIIGILYGLSFGLTKGKALSIYSGLTFVRLSGLAFLFYLLQSYGLNLILVLLMFLMTFWIIILTRAHRYGRT